MKIEVKVHPKAKKERVEDRGNFLEVWVKEPPEGGKANRKVIELIAKYLGVAKSDISILTGHRGRKKLLEVKDA